jgi:hypothetical protein
MFFPKPAGLTHHILCFSQAIWFNSPNLALLMWWVKAAGLGKASDVVG